MILFLSLLFFGVVYLLVKIRLLPWTRVSQGAVVLIYLTSLILLVVCMNLYQPYTPNGIVSARVTPIVSRVAGRIVEVPVQSNQELKKGDILLRIDPAPYEAEVERLQAELAGAEQRVPQLEAAVDAAKASLEYAEADLSRQEVSVASGAVSQDAVDRARSMRDVRKAELVQAELSASSEIDGVNTDVARLQAALRSAQINLDECVIRAPADGRVTQLFAQEGAVTSTMQFSAAMTFVYDDSTLIRAGIRSTSLRHVEIGDAVEIAYQCQPGKVFSGKVSHISLGTGEGALAPSGSLSTSDQLMAGSPAAFIAIQVDEDQIDFDLPIGTTAAVAVYTGKGESIAIIRKIILRMQAWRYYL